MRLFNFDLLDFSLRTPARCAAVFAEGAGTVALYYCLAESRAMSSETYRFTNSSFEIKLLLASAWSFGYIVSGRRSSISPSVRFKFGKGPAISAFDQST